MDNMKNEKETAIQDEQQLKTQDEILTSIEASLKSIAESLDKIFSYGIIIYPNKSSYPTK